MGGNHSASAPSPTGRRSVAVPERAWYPACRSKELKGKPTTITFLGRPVALWRDNVGAPHAVVDRCPHRNVPLSAGEVADDGCIQCPYHGWRFDGTGACRAVPGLLEGDAASSPVRDVVPHPCLEQDGFVWIWGKAGDVPDDRPLPIPNMADAYDGRHRPGWQMGEVIFPCDLEATLHAALENTLDVPHTAFLHRGLFRGAKLKEIHATRRELDGGVEVEFGGEPVGIGPIQGGPFAKRTFQHWDRFLGPNVAQVEYRVDGWLHLYNHVIHLPLTPTLTRAWFVFRWWSLAPAQLIRPIIAAQGRVVLKQDATALALMNSTIDTFGGERFTNTDLDMLGPAIWRLLRRAERAEQPEGGADLEGRLAALVGEVAPDAQLPDDLDTDLTFTA